MDAYQIIDNFLNPEDFEKIQVMLTPKFPWFFCDRVNSTETDLGGLNAYQFVHSFYKNFVPNSDFAPLIYPVVNKLKLMSLVRIKANLLARTEGRVYHGYHTDYHSPLITTAVYYVNTNDGVTALKIGNKIEEVKSVANRIVIFNSRVEHTGTSCTDQKVRCVINFNYVVDRK